MSMKEIQLYWSDDFSNLSTLQINTSLQIYIYSYIISYWTDFSAFVIRSTAFSNIMINHVLKVRSKYYHESCIVLFFYTATFQQWIVKLSPRIWFVVSMRMSFFPFDHIEIDYDAYVHLVLSLGTTYWYLSRIVLLNYVKTNPELTVITRSPYVSSITVENSIILHDMLRSILVILYEISEFEFREYALLHKKKEFVFSGNVELRTSLKLSHIIEKSFSITIESSLNFAT